MTTLPGLVTPVADLLRHPGERRHIALELARHRDRRRRRCRARRLRARDRGGPRVAVRRDRGQRDGASAVASRVPALPRARARSARRARFVRCTRSRTRAATDDEVFPISADSIDLGPAVHDALAARAPARLRCASDACAGLCPICGVDRNHARCSCRVDNTDPRWAALDVLRLPPQARFDPGPAGR